MGGQTRLTVLRHELLDTRGERSSIAETCLAELGRIAFRTPRDHIENTAVVGGGGRWPGRDRRCERKGAIAKLLGRHDLAQSADCKSVSRGQSSPSEHHRSYDAFSELVHK
jgi:hypothetical protein